MFKSKLFPLLFLCLIFLLPVLLVSSLNEISDDSWIHDKVVGDSFQFFHYFHVLDLFIQDYQFSALHNSLGCWMESITADWPEDWAIIRARIASSHESNIPIGAVYGYYPSDDPNLPFNEELGFLHMYRTIPEIYKWRTPSGEIADEPYTSGTSKTYTGTQVWRSFSDEEAGAVMQTQNPYWFEYFVDWSKTILDQGADGIMYDNVDMIFPLFWHGGFGGEDTWEGLACTRARTFRADRRDNDNGRCRAGRLRVKGDSAYKKAGDCWGLQGRSGWTHGQL